jgi:phage protein D
MPDNAFQNSRPTFLVNGELREDLQESTTGLVINLPLQGCAHAEITLTDWGTPEDEDDADHLFTDLLLGSEIEIAFGEEGEHTVFVGDVTAVEEQYGDGAPTLALLLQDALHKLGRIRQSHSYEDMSPNDVVEQIANNAGLSTNIQVSTLVNHWNQINESELAFLLRFCGRFDVAARIDDGQLRAKPEEADADPIELTINDNVTRARFIADLNHQPSQTRVQGFNPANASTVDFDASDMMPEPSDTSAKSELNNLGWSVDEIVAMPFARSQAEAETYAKAHFTTQAKRFIQADLTCQGEASLKSGREVLLTGTSSRFEGTYRIVHCTHKFTSQTGFETSLKLNKADWRPSS